MPAAEKTEEKGKESPFVNKFQRFFHSVYRKEIEKLAESYPEKRSLLLDFSALGQFDFKLADALLENPDELLAAAEFALEGMDLPTLEQAQFKPHVRFFNLPEDSAILLRDIGSKHLGKMISIEGIIKQITDVLPKLRLATFKCNRCGNVYRVLQSSRQVKKPDFCACRHRDFSLVAEDSDFIDFQKIQVQEPLESLKGNDQPTSLDIYISDDFVNRASVGDKIEISGILRLYPTKQANLVFGRFLECNYLEETARGFEEVEVGEEEEKEIKALARDPAIYEKLVKSVAPMIYGHEVVKEAIILQLFGGVKKILPGEQAIRGNIHVLLVGDPGVAKSQLLMAANNIAPKSIYVGGRTTSGAGLTATAVKDEFGEGGWTLKAGALVLASGGTTMADELDKMDPVERTALHECMEQGTISVAKAGIITRFKTDTSILAAANPRLSRFDPFTPFMEQVELPATLVSRFDLFFMIRDVLDRTLDSEIAAHVLKAHQAGEKLFKAKVSGEKLKKSEIKEIEDFVAPAIPPELLRKYIAYTRQHVFPNLTKEAIELISDFYVGLRERGKEEGTYAATHRQLEGLVRLSEASARIRLSDVVEKEDAERAVRMLRSSLKDVVTDPETGKIDFDIVATGKTHTKTEGMRTVLKIVKDLAKQSDRVSVEDVTQEAKTFNIEGDRVQEYLNELVRRGELYRPRHGLIMPAEAK